MNDLLGRRQVAAKMVAVFALVVLTAAPSFALSILSANFDSPTYVVGPLEGQASWQKAASSSTATVQSGVGMSGTQGVEVSRAAADDAYWWVPSATYPSGYGTPPNRYIDISWDMRVLQADTSNSMYGPFFGVVASQDDRSSTKWFGALGVDGATGELMYTGGAGGALVTVGGSSGTVNFGDWHNYMIRLDVQTSTYSLYKDNVGVLAGLPWVDSGLNSFTDADIMATASDGNGANATGKAYIDNFSVSQVPEPSTVALGLAALLSLGFAAACRRRTNVA